MLDSPPSFGFEIERGDPREASVAALLRRSEEYAHSLYPPESVHMLPVEELLQPHVKLFVARDLVSGEPLGCCALVLQAHACAELKRMFVEAPAKMRSELRDRSGAARRRKGVGAELMRVTELTARAEGVRTLRFETGPDQPHAIALGHRFGYVRRGPYGDYRDDPNSVFMEKRLDKQAAPPQGANGEH